jgi:hypothetical protein
LLRIYEHLKAGGGDAGRRAVRLVDPGDKPLDLLRAHIRKTNRADVHETLLSLVDATLENDRGRRNRTFA